ncbi:MAG: CGNR zinc finger domain-containing protein [Carbonactinosporaceae bacterium]
MFLGHDTERALSAVVDLVNTAPQACGDERLPGVPSLLSWVDGHAISEVGHLTGADVEAVRTIRGKLHAVFRAGDLRSAVQMVNALVAEARTTPRLTDHDGYDWHVHYFAPGASLAEHLAADGGMALAFLLAAGELERLRTCDAPDCRRVLVDLSRNRCRRYCDSRTCGNRLHVAAYRARRRMAAGDAR